jgi:nucleotide-binding universal stress UspA family protein
MTPPVDNQGQPIVIGYDGSDHAKEAVREAGRLFPGRRAVLINAFPSAASTVAAAAIGVPAATLGAAIDGLDEAAREGAQGRVDEGVGLARDAGLEPEGRIEMVDGPDWAAIERTAEETDAAAVIVGTRGLSTFKQVLLGSTSDGLVRHSSRPVVVVPSGPR